MNKSVIIAMGLTPVRVDKDTDSTVMDNNALVSWMIIAQCHDSSLV